MIGALFRENFLSKKNMIIYINHGHFLGAAQLDQNVGSTFHGRVSPVFIRFQNFH